MDWFLYDIGVIGDIRVKRHFQFIGPILSRLLLSIEADLSTSSVTEYSEVPSSNSLTSECRPRRRQFIRIQKLKNTLRYNFFCNHRPNQ